MFSTGQVAEGAVNYTNASAVCGHSVNGADPIQATNQTNLSLPAIASCAQPIGPKWVASVTNWLCYVVDAAGLTFNAGSVCQNPRLLYLAIKAIIADETSTMIRSIADSPTEPAAPAPGEGRDGDYAITRHSGNFYGPRVAGVWPATPFYWGNNRVKGVQNIDTTIEAYNALIEIGGVVPVVTTIPTPVGHGNEELTIVNDSSVTQHILSAGGIIAGYPNYVSAINPVAIVSGQILGLRSDNVNWIVISDNLASTAIGGTYVLKDCSGTDLTSGDQVVSCAEYTAGINTFNITGVGAAISCFGAADTASSGAVGTTGGWSNIPATTVHKWTDGLGNDFEIADSRWPSTTPPAGIWEMRSLSYRRGPTLATGLATFVRVS